MTSAMFLKSIRVVHRCLGLFFAPTILFFSITGGLQMFGLHETARGSSYAPPSFLVHLAQLHKKGTLYFPPRKLGPVSSPKRDEVKPDSSRPEAPKQTPAPPPPSSLPIKIFFAATALALVLSTCTGLIMSWKYARRKSTALLTLAAGIVIPILLLLI